MAKAEKLLSLKDVLVSSWNVYKSNFLVLIFLSAIPIVLPIFTAFIQPSGVVGGILAFLIIIITTLMIVWSLIAMIIVIRDRGKKLDFKKVINESIYLCLSYLWVVILAGLLEMGGYLLLIIPGIIFSVWFIFADIMLITEKEKGINALLKSKEYVKGHWWNVFGLYLFIFIFVGLLTSGNIFENTSGIVARIIEVLVVPFGVVYMYMMYEGLKRIKPSLKFKPTKKQRTWVGVGALWGVIATVLLAVTLMSALAFIFSGANFDLDLNNSDSWEFNIES